MIQQDFTSAPFSDLLKQHGIEIDTPFYNCLISYGVQLGNGEWSDEWDLLICLKAKNGYVNLQDGILVLDKRIEDVRPAYPLTQVLRWLPFSVNYQKQSATLSLIVDHDGVRVNYRIGEYAIYNKYLPIEQLFTQGLKEGWLNKDNLNL